MSSSDEDFSDDEEMHDPGATITVLKRAKSGIRHGGISADTAARSGCDALCCTGLADMEVVTKYKEAARIANAAIEQVLGACDAGASVVRRGPCLPPPELGWVKSVLRRGLRLLVRRVDAVGPLQDGRRLHLGGRGCLVQKE